MASIRFPLICILIISCILIYYKVNKSLKTESSESFRKMMFHSLVNVLFGAITEYTVNHREIISDSINTFLHIIFITSLLHTSYHFYKLILSYVKDESLVSFLKKEKKVSKVLLILGYILICVVPITYIDHPYGSYSHGPKAYVLYALVIFYVLSDIRHLIMDRKFIDKKIYYSICVSLSVFTFFCVLQIFTPYVLFSSIGITLEVVIIYLALENSEKFLDKDKNLFNYEGFLIILKEKLLYNRSQYLMLFAFDNVESSFKNMDNLLNKCGKYLNKKSISCYKISDNVIAIFTDNPNYSQIDEIKQKHNISIYTETFGLSNKTLNKIISEIDDFVFMNIDSELFLDKMTRVFNRNKYELDVPVILNKYKEFAYVMIDINNLKTTNDTLGHEKGDFLIKEVAGTLLNVFNKHSYIYRLGGDEFAIVYTQKDIIEKIKELKSRNSYIKNDIPIEFAVGFDLYDNKEKSFEEVSKAADYKMYKDKMELKSIPKIQKTNA